MRGLWSGAFVPRAPSKRFCVQNVFADVSESEFLQGLSFFFSAEVCHVPRAHAFACVEGGGQQFAKRALVEFPVRKRRPVNLAAACAPAAQKDRGIGRAILFLYEYRPILQRFKDAAAIPVCIGIRAVYCAKPVKALPCDPLDPLCVRRRPVVLKDERMVPCMFDTPKPL